ncbi:hypothetical protein OOT46_08995 [Aquabacterium sp. A7-Y]|uniref:hypothetical protein n=1 Tax=Aquabacterium sp. A7-Y TaxID=1349605 RepID=UPI00223D6DA2|nr:hypothetical protein [Aquabacterium sp. A7-Y]MCW7537984.1 hypothetical protein [Aquabacterium sp. A7-Y]
MRTGLSVKSLFIAVAAVLNEGEGLLQPLQEVPPEVTEEEHLSERVMDIDRALASWRMPMRPAASRSLRIRTSGRSLRRSLRSENPFKPWRPHRAAPERITPGLRLAAAPTLTVLRMIDRVVLAGPKARRILHLALFQLVGYVVLAGAAIAAEPYSCKGGGTAYFWLGIVFLLAATAAWAVWGREALRWWLALVLPVQMALTVVAWAYFYDAAGIQFMCRLF